ncbi:MAG: histidine--tRNA ligase [Candidatus Acidiferrales bacterium]
MTEEKQARKFQAIKGVRDILPPESALWNRVEQTARDVFATYNFREIRLPVIEHSELFARSVGIETDIVMKEMYTFPDPTVVADRDFLAGMRALRDLHDAYQKNRGYTIARAKEYVAAAFAGLSEGIESAASRLISLRPEATASVVRAYIEHGMHTLPGDVKLYYIGPMFRRERPQKGRYRQFYQIGAEVLGQSDSPSIDAEVIEMLMAYLERLGLRGTTLYVNSIGCKDCRPAYVAMLRDALLKVKDQLGADSQHRIETNPLRVLDSKVESEQALIEKLPRIADHLCDSCRANFSAFQEQLKQRGIAYEINWRLVRGLDYYMRTTFEITVPGLGAQNAICGGGRYDGLVELLGGPPAKGIGFAIGTDRLVLALQEANKLDVGSQLDVFIAWLGVTGYPAAVQLARRLRAENFSVELPAEDMKLKKSLGLADKLGARYAVLLGDDELTSGSYILRRLADGEQKKLSEPELVGYLKSDRRP